MSHVDQSKKYFRIRFSTVLAEKKTSFPIFVRIDGKMILYLNAGDKLAESKIIRLDSKDTGSSFFVLEEDRSTYREWVREDLLSPLISPLEKAKILRETSLALIEDMFDNTDVNTAINEARPIISDFLEFIQSAPEAMGFMISLSGHDFYTYAHSLDVSIYSLGLGSVLGLKGSELEELGVASLFHDIGKRNVNLNILCKKGTLDEAEWAQMKMHPQYGLMILNQNPTISDAIKAACFEHHESFDGGGYPQQISGSEIHPFARIVAITDTYDAMTTQRSYNIPLKPIDAIKMMKEKLASRYDPEMLKALHSILFKINAA